ncbi:hypothetical protein [Methanospirillum purgamenti]|mgnify:FL=1|jgi:chemotaxis protein CheC|uniref:Chemotaxis protein CheC n=1 Tax=Methanospirillum hungatei TaxID=2203 RepID=A0A8F5VR12_METHU|nr:hypothetical protein [Methanospirillum hungatei]QXO96135.1 hypothetical protein KSK55_07145 [Methanospirillum hungatei]
MEISEEVIDGIRELVTIGVGHSAGMLNDLTNAHITLTVPDVHIFKMGQENAFTPVLYPMTPEGTSQVTMSFFGECTGSLHLIFPNKSAINLVIILTKEDESPDEMDALRVETLMEVGNIIMSSVMSSFSILLTSRLSFLFPSYQTGIRNMNNSASQVSSDIGIMARTRFEVHEKEIEGLLFFFLTESSFKHIQKRILEIMECGL